MSMYSSSSHNYWNCKVKQKDRKKHVTYTVIIVAFMSSFLFIYSNTAANTWSITNNNNNTDKITKHKSKNSMIQRTTTTMNPARRKEEMKNCIQYFKSHNTKHEECAFICSGNRNNNHKGMNGLSSSSSSQLQRGRKNPRTSTIMHQACLVGCTAAYATALEMGCNSITTVTTSSPIDTSITTEGEVEITATTKGGEILAAPQYQNTIIPINTNTNSNTDTNKKGNECCLKYENVLPKPDIVSICREYHTIATEKGFEKGASYYYRNEP